MAHPDFEELLAEFNGARVRYLIGGAHALALHARPRASKDLDIYVDPTPANAIAPESARYLTTMPDLTSWPFRSW